MKFKTKYIYGTVQGELFDEKTLTEQSGYVDTKTQIDQLVYAGAKLNAFRKEMFDSENENGDLKINPLRKPGIDFVEAERIGKEAATRIKERMKKKEKIEEKEEIKKEIIDDKKKEKSKEEENG